MQSEIKYRYKDYWYWSYHSLKEKKRHLERKKSIIYERFVTMTKDENGNPRIAAHPKVFETLADHAAEIAYLKRVIRIRKFWRPYEWLYGLSCWYNDMWTDLITSYYTPSYVRAEKMDDKKRIAYYKGCLARIEKKILTSYHRCCEQSVFMGIMNGDKYKWYMDMFISLRKDLLNRMFRGTKNEMQHFKDIDKRLSLMSVKLQNKMNDLYRRDKTPNLSYNCCGTIQYSICALEDNKQRLQELDFYGSRLKEMMEITGNGKCLCLVGIDTSHKRAVQERETLEDADIYAPNVPEDMKICIATKLILRKLPIVDLLLLDYFFLGIDTHVCLEERIPMTETDGMPANRDSIDDQIRAAERWEDNLDIYESIQVN